jgi:hypothetical protein
MHAGAASVARRLVCTGCRAVQDYVREKTSSHTQLLVRPWLEAASRSACCGMHVQRACPQCLCGIRPAPSVTFIPLWQPLCVCDHPLVRAPDHGASQRHNPRQWGKGAAAARPDGDGGATHVRVGRGGRLKGGGCVSHALREPSCIPTGWVVGCWPLLLTFCGCYDHVSDTLSGACHCRAVLLKMFMVSGVTLSPGEEDPVAHVAGIITNVTRLKEGRQLLLQPGRGLVQVRGGDAGR